MRCKELRFCVGVLSRKGLFFGCDLWCSESEDPFELSLPFCVEKGKIDCNISLVLGLFRDNSLWPIRAAEILLPDSDWISKFDWSHMGAIEGNDFRRWSRDESPRGELESNADPRCGPSRIE